ncbi:YciI family protein [Actibacterium sp. MT2.3-13A]|uniref:YciI family protein n=1 Tax=Actibacterium sp. MT2.3-13A TaxID=2828332 RepID=UPI001BA6816F|nr:YciI family protein [Actibacterium sp. MT2.3-13A]
MLYALICRDKPGHLDTRKANRDAHLAYIAETGVVAQAGPFLDDAGEMCGSLVILDVETADAAQAWTQNDPYAKAGLFENVTVQAWKKVIG